MSKSQPAELNRITDAFELIESSPLIERTIRFSVAREPGDEGLVALRGAWRSMPAERELEP